MDHEKEWEFEQTLAESEWLLRDAARSASDEGEPTLESILAEFGSADAAAPAKPPAGSAAVHTEEPAEQAAMFCVPEPEIPETNEDKSDKSPTVSLREVLENTVQSVLDEGSEKGGEPEELLPPPRRGLFSRRRMQDTEQLYGAAEPEPPEEEEEPEDVFADDFGERESEPEPPAHETAAEYRELAREATRASRACCTVTVLCWAALLLDRFGVMPALYAQEPLLNCLPFLIAEILVCVLGRDVFVYAAEQLRTRTVTYELIT